MSVSGEGQKDVETRTFGELRRDVARLSAVMRKAGIKKGDRVVGGCRGRVSDGRDIEIKEQPAVTVFSPGNLT